MKIRYLAHSGFFVETKLACYVFDYIRGNLPSFPTDKPLYLLASHIHGDHFDPIIFEHDLPARAACYILGNDIKKKWKRAPQIIPSDVTSKCLWAMPGEIISLPTGDISFLKSTDQGVAFVVRESDGTKLYHAGDLNWWHWEGEDYSWNRNMEVDYKREIGRLKGEHFDVAFVPVDPRLENAYYFGLNYFLETLSASHVFPMHFWGKYEIIPRFVKEHGISLGYTFKNQTDFDLHSKSQTFCTSDTTSKQINENTENLIRSDKIIHLIEREDQDYEI